MATTITLNSSVTLDESPGLQNSGTAVGAEDNNDSDINPADLQASFKLRLDALSLTSYTGAARSADGMITVSSDGTLNNLGFTSSNGTAHGGTLPTYTTGALGTAGSASNLSAVNGGSIGLFADAVLGNRMVLGVDGAGQIVFALFMEPNSALTSARIWMAQFEPIVNTNTGNPDDPMSLSGLGVGASGSLNFNFNALPSGQNLFGMVGTSSDGLVVIGKTPVPSGTSYTNASDTINTSQGGGPTTIGINNQMFDAGDGAYFTYVKNPVPAFLAGAPNGLDQNEADNVGNIQYTGGTTEVSTGYAIISQTQSGAAASMSISAFNISGAPQGAAFIAALGQGPVNITAVRIYNGDTEVSSQVFGPAGVAVATVGGLRAGYKVEWDTALPHDQALLSGVSGKFDIGGFGAVQDTATAVPLSNVRFEDDGPTLSASATDAPTLTVDDSTLGDNSAGSFSTQFTPSFGTDGQGALPRSYALSTPGGNSGLVDTASNQSVVLSLVGGQVQGRTATSDELVFTVSVNALGSVTLDQIRAVKHDDTTLDDESVTLTAANLVVLTGTAVDGDGDSALAPLNIGQLLVFKDDAPTISATAVGAPVLTVDDSDFTTDASGEFAAQFTPIFGGDGAGTTPRSYALSTPGGESGLVDTATNQNVVLSLVGGQVQGRTATSNELVFTVSVTTAGAVTLDQLRAVKHPNIAANDESTTLSAANLVVLTGSAVDGDGDSDSAPLNIGQWLVFKDDAPTISASAVGAPALTVDDSDFTIDASGEYAAQFTPVFGADGQGAQPRSYALSTPGGASGLVDTATNQNVLLSLVGGQVQGRTATSNDLVFTVSVSALGAVTLDQIRAVKHTDIAATDESTTLTAANLVVLTGTAVDGDGDSASAPLNIGQLLVFKDDAPTIGNISSSIVDFVKDASTGPVTLNGVVGADTNTSPYTLTQFTQSITTNGVELKGVLSANSQEVIYWANTNNSSTFGDAGDTAYYQLTLGQAGAGNYTFKVLVDPPPATREFNFNALPSGQNLFGMVGNPEDGLIVFGKSLGNTINTSQGGGPTTIGINNQMFDASEGAYFTLVTDPDTRYLAGAPGGLDQNEADVAANMRYGDTLEVNTSFVVVSQTQGNTLGSMKITAFDINLAPQGADLVAQRGTNKVNITEVRVVNGDSNVSATIDANGIATVTGLRAGYKVEWTTDAVHDQVLIDATGGKFDIGGFGTTQGADTPDQLLAFEARVTDGDGDTALDDFTIGIDGTGIYDDGAVSVTVTV